MDEHIRYLQRTIIQAKSTGHPLLYERGLSNISDWTALTWLHHSWWRLRVPKQTHHTINTNIPKYQRCDFLTNASYTRVKIANPPVPGPSELITSSPNCVSIHPLVAYARAAGARVYINTYSVASVCAPVRSVRQSRTIIFTLGTDYIIYTRRVLDALVADGWMAGWSGGGGRILLRKLLAYSNDFVQKLLFDIAVAGQICIYVLEIASSAYFWCRQFGVYRNYRYWALATFIVC